MHRERKNIRLAQKIVCPYCMQEETHFFDLVEAMKYRIGEVDFIKSTFPCTYNLREHVRYCDHCRKDFTVHLHIQIKTEFHIRKVDPPSISVVDDGEYIIDNNGHVIKNN